MRNALAAVIAGLVVACAPPTPGAGLPPTRLYALNALDGTLTPLDDEPAAIARAPLPAGDSPAQAAPGPDGSILVLSFSRDRPGRLTHVVRQPRGWQTHSVPIAFPLQAAILAADGRRFAAVGYHVPGQPATETTTAASPALPAARPCRLALLDLHSSGAPTIADHAVCAAGEQVTGVALGGGPDAPVANLGIWDARGPATEPDSPPPLAPSAGIVPARLRHRIVALDARAGHVLAVRRLDSPPEQLQVVTATSGSGQSAKRVYVLEGVPGADNDYATSGRWRLLRLHPETLEMEQETIIGIIVRAVAVAPGGTHAYALTAGGQEILHLDLGSGITRRLGTLPEQAAGGLTVTARHVLVPNPLGHDVWVLDRHDGRLVATIPVGRRPIAVLATQPTS